MSNSILANPPKYLRAPVSRGAAPKVERNGGFRQAGLIRGVSVITQGEALGHRLWIDATMVEQVSEAINLRNKGVKSRFTHPSLSGDGLGKFVGRIMDSELSADGRQALADQHFTEAGHSTPDGDLAGYLMDLAQEDPEAYGLSIVFELDYGAMDRFDAEHTDERGTFTSPDAANTQNFPHARLAELRAIDAVDEPAANPDGLFHREQDIIEQAEALASFALGLTSAQPETVRLGLDPDRVRGFVSRFLTNHNLEVRPMADDKQPADPTNPVPAPAVDEKKPAEPAPAPAPAAETAPAPVAAGDRSEAKRFREAFGPAGSEWYCDGLTFEQAQVRFTKEWRERDEQQQKQIAELTKRLGAAPAGEQTPVGFEPAEKPQRNGFASRIRIAGAK